MKKNADIKAAIKAHNNDETNIPIYAEINSTGGGTLFSLEVTELKTPAIVQTKKGEIVLDKNYYKTLAKFEKVSELREMLSI